MPRKNARAFGLQAKKKAESKLDLVGLRDIHADAPILKDLQSGVSKAILLEI